MCYAISHGLADSALRLEPGAGVPRHGRRGLAVGRGASPGHDAAHARSAGGRARAGARRVAVRSRREAPRPHRGGARPARSRALDGRRGEPAVACGVGAVVVARRHGVHHRGGDVRRAPAPSDLGAAAGGGARDRHRDRGHQRAARPPPPRSGHRDPHLPPRGARAVRQEDPRHDRVAVRGQYVPRSARPSGSPPRRSAPRTSSASTAPTR